jgi:ABC-2 type transport system permease protein
MTTETLGAARRVRRTLRVSTAFLRMDYLITMAYPLAFVVTEIQAISTIVIFYFISHLVVRPSARTAGDYFSFVVLGLVATQFVNAGLQGLGSSLVRTVTEGRFEMLLIEPIRWRFLPFGLVQWPIIIQGSTSVITVIIALLLGASFTWSGIGLGIVFILLASATGVGLAVLAASVRVLAKQGDPILGLYMVAASVLSGVYFAPQALPGPLAAMARLIPNTYVIAGLRHSLLPGELPPGGPSTATCLLVLVLINAALFPIAVWLFGRSMEYGRRLGVLAGY